MDDVSTASLSNINEERQCPEDCLRRNLKFFFLNPCAKFKAKGRFPWKLVLQLVKIILVTVQLAMFGFTRSAHVEFLEKSNVAFSHLLLKDWTSAYETMPYPPASGAFAVYTIPDFYDSVNYAMRKYNETEKDAIGTYAFTRVNGTQVPMRMCKKHFRVGKISAHNQTYKFDAAQVTECFNLYPVVEFDKDTKQEKETFDIKQYLTDINETINFDRLITLTLHVSLKTIHLKYLSQLDTPDCFLFNITITYDISAHSGQMKISLTSDETALPCHGHVFYDNDEKAIIILMSFFDALVIIVSVMSLGLCARSIFRAQRLRRFTVEFFRDRYGTKLDQSDQLEFLNMWYVLIILNDFLTVTGSIFKIGIENKVSTNYEICGVLLGTGNLLVWFGVLRYLGFFRKYNILILTMKRSAPNIFRFLVCAGVFYFGFTICGWVVLGPYHIKFRYISTASECLFSLVNGDDMFTTFAAITQTNSYVWWYSRVYLYTFISLFIYVVLSVFISVIMDTYETIKSYYTSGFPRTVLEQFIDQCTDEPHTLFQRDHDSNCCDLGSCCLCTCFTAGFWKRQPRSNPTDEPNEYTSLIS